MEKVEKIESKLKFRIGKIEDILGERLRSGESLRVLERNGMRENGGEGWERIERIDIEINIIGLLGKEKRNKIEGGIGGGIRKKEGEEDMRKKGGENDRKKGIRGEKKRIERKDKEKEDGEIDINEIIEGFGIEMENGRNSEKYEGIGKKNIKIEKELMDG